MKFSVARLLATSFLTGEPISLKLGLLINSSTENVEVLLNTIALKQTCLWAEREIYVLQLAKLKQLLYWAKSVPYWQAHLRRINFTSFSSLGQISKLPITTRQSLTLVPLENRSDVAKAKNSRAVIGTTSGSTGHPLQFYRSKISKIRTRGIYQLIMEQAAHMGGLAWGNPRAFNLGIQRQQTLYPWAEFLWGTKLEEAQKNRTEFYEILRSRKIQILYTNASYLKRLYYWMDKDNEFFQFRCIVYIAQQLNKRERSELEKFFKCPTLSIYGTQECSVIGIECSEQQEVFHMVPELGYLEITDYRKRDLPIGQIGEVTYTYFENEISPFIRYQVGDQGKIEPRGRCACGKSGEVLFFEGKTAEIIDLPDGSGVIVKAISIAIDEALAGRIYQFQLIQEGHKTLRIKIIPKDEFNNEEEDSLVTKITSMLHYSMDVVVEKVKVIPSGLLEKTPLFIKSV